jgi:hypothetical protein
VRTGSGGGGGARQGRAEVWRGGRSSIRRWRARIQRLPRRRWPLASSSPSPAPSIANGVHHRRRRSRNTTSPSITGGGSASSLRENAAAVVASGARGGAARGIEEPLDPSGFEGREG